MNVGQVFSSLRRWPSWSRSSVSASRAGLRLSAVINIGTATIGSTVAAKGLGEVILAGLGTGNTAFVLQGGVIVGLLAVLVYDALGLVEAHLARRAGRA